jgi:hypothetical protein
MGAIDAAGTPRLRINGVTIDGAADMKNQQLSDLITNLFSTGEDENVHCY